MKTMRAAKLPVKTFTGLCVVRELDGKVAARLYWTSSGTVPVAWPLASVVILSTRASA